jgi:hypothetical protein
MVLLDVSHELLGKSLISCYADELEGNCHLAEDMVEDPDTTTEDPSYAHT